MDDPPIGVVVDLAHNGMYVANYGDDTVSVIDAATAQVTAIGLRSSGPHGVAVDEVRDLEP